MLVLLRYSGEMVNQEFEIVIAIAAILVGVTFLWIAKTQPD